MNPTRVLDDSVTWTEEHPVGGYKSDVGCQRTATPGRLHTMEAALRSADTNADFELYYAAMLPRILGLAFSVTGDRCDAEDVAVETLARTFLRWSRLSHAKWRDGWVLRVAANQSIDILRRRQRSRSIAEETTEHATTAREPSEFSSILRTLPRRQQEVVVLRYYGDLSYAEIAHRLHISQGSVKTHLHRGIASLRKDLDVSVMEGEDDVEHVS
jgi:RNA polymerase sigma-70 factor (sigma-E family)